jgi:hypothetical protein
LLKNFHSLLVCLSPKILFLRCTFHAKYIDEGEPYKSRFNESLTDHCWFCGVKTKRCPYGCIPKGYRDIHTLRTRDHLFPRSKAKVDGNTSVETVTACHRCNSMKGNRTLEEFRALYIMLTGNSDYLFHAEKFGA